MWILSEEFKLLFDFICLSIYASIYMSIAKTWSYVKVHYGNLPRLPVGQAYRLFPHLNLSSDEKGMVERNTQIN